MKIYDITLVLSHTLPVWPGDPAFSLEQEKSIEAGDGANVSRLEMGVHTGTHIDAPFHFLASGEKSDSISLERLMGPCRVIELPVERHITEADLAEHDISGCERVLLKTKNSQQWSRRAGDFFHDFIALELSAARYLVSMGVELAGIDYLSIEKFSGDGTVHRYLLENNLLPLEGLDLSAVAPGDYELICLPLKLAGCDGLPVRAVLRQLDIAR